MCMTNIHLALSMTRVKRNTMFTRGNRRNFRMYVYMVQSARPIAATIAPCKHTCKCNCTCNRTCDSNFAHMVRLPQHHSRGRGCRLTACTPGSAPDLNTRYRVWESLLFYLFAIAPDKDYGRYAAIRKVKKDLSVGAQLV